MNTYDREKVIEIAELAEKHLETAIQYLREFEDMEYVRFHEGAHDALCDVLHIMTGYQWNYSLQYMHVLPYGDHGELIEEW